MPLVAGPWELSKLLLDASDKVFHNSHRLAIDPLDLLPFRHNNEMLFSFDKVHDVTEQDA